jgi:hypothetical protein
MWSVLLLVVKRRGRGAYYIITHPITLNEFYRPAEQCRSLAFWLGAEAETIDLDA